MSEPASKSTGPKRTFEDFVPGLVLELPSYTVTREEIVEFAAEFDPQPFHLDEEAAKATLLGGLSASGWHTCSMMMRMIVDGYLSGSSAQGSPGVEHVRWLRPVRPGDTLTGRSTVLEARLSASRPQLGIVRIETELATQTGEPVLNGVYSVFLKTREAAR